MQRHKALLKFYGYYEQDPKKLSDDLSVLQGLVWDWEKQKENILSVLGPNIDFEKDFPLLEALKKHYTGLLRKDALKWRRGLKQNTVVFFKASSTLIRAKELYVLIARIRDKKDPITDVTLKEGNVNLQTLFEYQTNRNTNYEGLPLLKCHDVNDKVFYLQEKLPISIKKDKMPLKLLKYETQFGETKKFLLKTAHATIDNRREYGLCAQDPDSTVDFQIWQVDPKSVERAGQSTWEKNGPRFSDLSTLVYSSDPSFKVILPGQSHTSPTPLSMKGSKIDDRWNDDPVFQLNGYYAALHQLRQLAEEMPECIQLIDQEISSLKTVIQTTQSALHKAIEEGKKTDAEQFNNKHTNVQQDLCTEFTKRVSLLGQADLLKEKIADYEKEIRFLEEALEYKEEDFSFSLTQEHPIEEKLDSTEVKAFFNATGFKPFCYLSSHSFVERISNFAHHVLHKPSDEIQNMFSLCRQSNTGEWVCTITLADRSVSATSFSHRIAKEFAAEKMLQKVQQHPVYYRTFLPKVPEAKENEQSYEILEKFMAQYSLELRQGEILIEESYTNDNKTKQTTCTLSIGDQVLGEGVAQDKASAKTKAACAALVKVKRIIDSVDQQIVAIDKKEEKRESTNVTSDGLNFIMPTGHKDLLTSATQPMRPRAEFDALRVNFDLGRQQRSPGTVHFAGYADGIHMPSNFLQSAPTGTSVINIFKDQRTPSDKSGSKAEEFKRPGFN